MAQVHKKFVDEQVKELIQRYLKKEIERKYIQQILGIGKTRFFALVKEYRKNPVSFSVQYNRKIKTRGISKKIEKNILKELAKDEKLSTIKICPLSHITIVISKISS